MILPSTQKMILAYITCKGSKEAKKIAVHLLKKRLIACANIFPIKSMYWWKGKIEESEETVLICKTNGSKYNKIKEEMKNMHSYSVPCIMKIEADANPEYADWVKKEL